MPHHTEHRFLPYRPAELFALVMDIPSYPQFLPWCEATRILHREEGMMLADMVIRFKGFHEKYTSRVTFDEQRHTIDVVMVKGPFSHLRTHWKFTAAEHGHGSRVDFSIDFRFRVKMLDMLIGALFQKAMQKLTFAFEERARHLYGAPLE